MTSDIVLWMFPALMLIIFLGVPVAFSLMIVALGFGWLRFGETLIHQFVSKIDDIGSNYVLGAIPLFIFMGSILERSGISERLFDAIYLWTRRLPGGLALSALIMCTIFAAASGVVGATETMVGMLALPAMMKRGYDKALMSGTICGGGSLGTIIPPSVPVVVLAPIATLPVGDLLAGILFPGLLMSGLFMLYIILACGLYPQLAPREKSADTTPVLVKIKLTLTALLPPIFLIFMVLGTLFLGWATPTEAAACGSAGTLLLAFAYRRLNLRVILEASTQTVAITAMILLIVLGGSMFSGVFFASGGMATTKAILEAFGLSGWSVMAIILLVTFLLGFIIDLISIVLIVIPIAIPLVKSFGIDPLWFAVVFLVVLQTSYLTPPMAPSIFYLRAIAPPSIRLGHMYKGVIPFIVCQIITLITILAFPDLATWLPKAIYG